MGQESPRGDRLRLLTYRAAVTLLLHCAGPTSQRLRDKLSTAESALGPNHLSLRGTDLKRP